MRQELVAACGLSALAGALVGALLGARFGPRPAGVEGSELVSEERSASRAEPAPAPRTEAVWPTGPDPLEERLAELTARVEELELEAARLRTDFDPQPRRAIPPELEDVEQANLLTLAEAEKRLQESLSSRQAARDRARRALGLDERPPGPIGDRIDALRPFLQLDDLQIPPVREALEREVERRREVLRLWAAGTESDVLTRLRHENSETLRADLRAVLEEEQQHKLFSL